MENPASHPDLEGRHFCPKFNQDISAPPPFKKNVILVMFIANNHVRYFLDMCGLDSQILI